MPNTMTDRESSIHPRQPKEIAETRSNQDGKEGTQVAEPADESQEDEKSGNGKGQERIATYLTSIAHSDDRRSYGMTFHPWHCKHHTVAGLAEETDEVAVASGLAVAERRHKGNPRTLPVGRENVTVAEVHGHRRTECQETLTHRSKKSERVCVNPIGRLGACLRREESVGPCQTLPQKGRIGRRLRQFAGPKQPGYVRVTEVHHGQYIVLPDPGSYPRKPMGRIKASENIGIHLHGPRQQRGCRHTVIPGRETDSYP